MSENSNDTPDVDECSQGEKLPQALYRGILPIGDIMLACAVLDNGERILAASSIFSAFGRPRKGSNSRLEIEGTKIPPFLASRNMEPYIDQLVISRTTPVEYMDGKQRKKGYIAALLPSMCEIYLSARRDGVLAVSQIKQAEQAEILLIALAKVGIDALIDEATGYQYDRKHDALRLLLSKYVAEGMQKWLKMFPDGFFAELDRLYHNAPTTSKNRPQYYGHFINKFVYDPIENGYVKAELNKLNIDDEGKRKAKFHQWLTSDGRSMLTMQIGRVQGVMELCQDIAHFKTTIKKQKQISIAPNLFDDMNRII